MPVAWRDNPLGVDYFIVCAVFQALATFFVALRLWGRHMQRQSLFLGDYAITVSIVLSLGNLVVLGIAVSAGMGKHVTDPEITLPDDLITFAKLQTAIGVIWAFNLFVIKVAIIDLYVTIFKRRKTFVKICWAYLAVQVAWCLVAALYQVLWCIPLAYMWDKTIVGGHCANLMASYYAAHLIIFFMDFTLAALPIPVLWSLQMDTRKKVGVAAMFLIGITVNVFDLLRVVQRHKIISPDATYEVALAFCFTLLEAQIGTIAACIPLIQPVARAAMSSNLMNSLRSQINWSRMSDTQNSRSGNLSRTMKSSISESDSVRGLHESEYGYNDHALQDVESGDRPMHKGVIKVTREWNVARDN